MTFLDTCGLVARTNIKQQRHDVANTVWARLIAAREPMMTTSLILIEVADTLSKVGHRREAMRIRRGLLASERVEVIAVTAAHETAAWELFERHRDEEWGMTDCVSFVVMEERGLPRRLHRRPALRPGRVHAAAGGGVTAEEKRAVLAEELGRYRRWPYDRLAAAVTFTAVEGCLAHVNRFAPDGSEYQIEVNVHWDGRSGGDVRVMADLSGSPHRPVITGIPVYVSDVCDSFIMAPDGTFVGE